MAKKSHLYDYHKANGKLTEFSGFDMPLWYKGIVEEHLAVRNAAGLFDVSHMGRAWIQGKDATKFLGKLLPTNPSMVKDGRAFYSTICNPKGGIIDDVITDRFSEEKYLMIVNAGNREKDFAWLRRISHEFEVEIIDFSNDSALIALQGPLAATILARVSKIDLTQLNRFAFALCEVLGDRCLVARTGYTGEDGFEITVFDAPVSSPEKAMKIWNGVLVAGKDLGLIPCGLGARDSLRLEAGMCLYGQDIDETTTPVEASLEFVVSDGTDRDFIGSEIIREQLEKGVTKKRIAFSMLEPGIPRHGYNVLFSDSKIGQVTSGTFSPTLKNGIGMAYVPPDLSRIGQKLTIAIRETNKFCEVVKTPFYDTTKYGFKRSHPSKSQ